MKIKDETMDCVNRQFRQYALLRKECDSMRQTIERKRSELKELQALLNEYDALCPPALHDELEQAIALSNKLIGYYALLIQKREAAEEQILRLLDRAPTDIGRQILYLHCIEGVSYKSIPEKLNISSRTMWYRRRETLWWLGRTIEEQSQSENK